MLLILRICLSLFLDDCGHYASLDNDETINHIIESVQGDALSYLGKFNRCLIFNYVINFDSTCLVPFPILKDTLVALIHYFARFLSLESYLAISVFLGQPVIIFLQYICHFT